MSLLENNKYMLATGVAWILMALGSLSALAPFRVRSILRFSNDWETAAKSKDKTTVVSTAALDWFHQRSSMAIAVVGLYWILYDFVRLKPEACVALVGLPFLVSSVHGILNEIPHQIGMSDRPDWQAILMICTKNGLLIFGSSYIVMAEKTILALTILPALQLYFMPHMVITVYQMPIIYQEIPCMLHHMKIYGLTLLATSTLGSTMLWQSTTDNSSEAQREVVLKAWGTIALIDVLLWSLLLPGISKYCGNMKLIYASVGLAAASAIVFVL